MTIPLPEPPKTIPLTPQSIFKTALILLDKVGLDALNMRTLATQLNVKAASLYNHIPSKSALLDGVQALIFAEVIPPSTKLPWKEYLLQLSYAFRKVLQRHPHAVRLFASRPSVFSTALLLAEHSLQRLIKAGFSQAQSLYLYQSVAVFVLGHALAELDPEGFEKDTPSNRMPPLPATADQFPTLAMIPRQVYTDTEQWFQSGIDFLLHGAESFLKKAKKTLSKKES